MKHEIKNARGAAKRFKVTATGKVKRQHAFARHILTKKTAKRKRQLGKSAVVDAMRDTPKDPAACCPTRNRRIDLRSSQCLESNVERNGTIAARRFGACEGLLPQQEQAYKFAKESVEKALVYAYRDRKTRKREFRRLWIIRIGAAARQNGLNYNQFIHGLKSGGRRSGSKDPRRHRAAGSGGLYAAGGDREERGRKISINFMGFRVRDVFKTGIDQLRSIEQQFDRERESVADLPFARGHPQPLSLPQIRPSNHYNFKISGIFRHGGARRVRPRRQTHQDEDRKRAR